jgi:hypothetical protein
VAQTVLAAINKLENPILFHDQHPRVLSNTCANSFSL